MASSALIGIDIGTTAVKAALIDLDGRPLQTFARPFATSRPRPGHVEQDPALWMEAVGDALASFAESTDGANVLGIGLTSQVNTHVFVDDADQPLLSAIVWQDGRSAKDAAALDAAVAAEQKAKWFGGPMPIDASHALARMAHIARVAPDLYQRTAHVLLPKDYCALKLTGEVATDPISSVGLVDQTHAYIEELIALVPGARDRLAMLSGFTDRVGVVGGGVAFAGTPVFAGTMDAWAGMFGVGVVRDGQAMYLSGTSEVTGIISDRLRPTAGVIVFPTYQGMRLHVAPTQSGGASLDWVARLIGRTPAEALELAASIPPSASLPVFLPHLQGERAPLWDIKARGVFARLDSAAGPGEIVRAVLEGVALSARLGFDALESSADCDADTVNMGGGGARSDLWCQIRADVLGKTVRRVGLTDAGVLGAAIFAGVGSGAFSALADAAERLVQFDRTFAPDREMAAHYDARFANSKRLYEDLKPFNHSFG